jgi:hypothetical protein
MKPLLMFVVFDDFYDASIVKRFSVLTELYSLSRHYNISIINVVHSYTMIASNLRRMAKWFILFKMTNEDEKKKMSYELCEVLELDTTKFLELFQDITTPKHQFMTIDCLGGKFYRNFLEY